MSSWKEYRFGELVHFPPRIGLRKGDEYPFIDMDVVNPNNRYVENIQHKKYESSSCSKFANGDVLLARITPCLENGKIAQVRTTDSENGFGSTEFFVFRANEKLLDQSFLFYLAKSNLIWKSAVNSMVGASGRQRADATFLKKVKLFIPDPPVQRKIAAILSAHDELIENNQRRIALLEKMAEQIYREWFVRLRFPGHEKVKAIKGVPEGWNLVRLEKAFEFTGGGTPTKEIARYWDDGDVNWFTPSDITGADGIFLEQSGERCSDEGYRNSSAKMFPAYSVMLTSRATIGAVGINITPACTNQGFITCIPNTQYPLPYLYHWIKLAKPYFELLSGGATFAELTKGTFKKIEILTPPEKLVETFDELESPIFKAIEMYQRQNTRLLATRDRLLPRLISGKLTVENFDIQFPPGMAAEMKAEADHA